MLKQILAWLLVVFALLGLADASYLTYEKLSHRVPACSPPFDCNTVLSSPWSSVGPIPLSMFGVAYYVVVLVLSALVFINISHLTIRKVTFHTVDLVWAVTWFGFGFSLYLVFMMGVILQAWCLFCLLSALTSSLLFVLASIQWWVRRGELVDHASSFRRRAIELVYGLVLKPIYFALDPEDVHNFMVQRGERLGATRATQNVVAWMFDNMWWFRSETERRRTSLRVIDGIRFPNVVGLAAGFDYDAHLTQILPAMGFGFMTVGTVTAFPYEGNTRPRLGRFPTSRALLVNKGYKNSGAVAISQKLSGMEFDIPVGISIGSTNREYSSPLEQIRDVVQGFEVFEASKVKHAYYELNVSCPNLKGGQPFTTPERLQKLVTAVFRLKITRPVYVKMPIDITDKEAVALLRILEKSPVKGVIFGNLTKDHTNPAVDDQDRTDWANKKGNLSGKPTWERSNRLIKLTRQTFGRRFTIIGLGGIFSVEDAWEKIHLGADLVQLITGMIYQGPQLVADIAAEVRPEIKQTERKAGKSVKKKSKKGKQARK